MKKHRKEFSKEDWQKIFDTSSSKRDVLRKIGLSMSSGNYDTLNRIIKKFDIDETQLKQNLSNLNKQLSKKVAIEKTKEQLFVSLTNDSNIGRGKIKAHLIKHNLIKFECAECKLPPEWNNKKLELQLDHINGISTDNRIENLRFLCPNCHSQTETFCRGIRKKKEKSCLSCGKSISKSAKFCSSCATKNYHFKKKEEK